jgi:predicted permease
MGERIAGLRRLLRVRRSAREQAVRDVDDEVRFHLESRVQELESSGVPSALAWQRAWKEFGNMDAARRVLSERVARRERRNRRNEWWDVLRHDAKYGFRRLRLNPGFSVVAVLTLAVGIGATAAIFSVVNGVLLKPVPWRDPERLVMVWQNDRVSGTTREPASAPDYDDFRARNRVFEEMAMFQTVEQNLTEQGRDPERVNVAHVSANMFSLLGVAPIFGRAFGVAQDVSGEPRIALLAEPYWRARFNADRDVVGHTIQLDDSVYTVVGVMAADVEFPDATTQLWVAAQRGPTSLMRDFHGTSVIARLAPGVTVAAAQADMMRIALALEEEYPQSNAARGAFVERVLDVMFGDVRPALLVLLSAVGLLLMIACVNVASLFLARGMARAREIAVRAALGAGSGRLARQFVVESLLVTLTAAALGVLLARLGLNGLLALLPADLPRAGAVAVDLRVLGVTVGIAALLGVMFGFVPTIQASRVNLQGALKSESDRSGMASRSRQRARSVLVVAEVAIAVVLVVGAGLLVRTVLALRSVDPGFRTDRVLRMEFQLPESRYARDFRIYPNWPRTQAFYASLDDALDRIPGAEASAVAAHHPLNPGFTNSFVIVGRESEFGSYPEIFIRAVSAGYFNTLDIPLLDGRGIEDRDRAHAPMIAVLNEAARRRYFPDGRAIGQQLQWWGYTREIVGVVGDERINGLTMDAPPAVYVPLPQAPMNSGSVLVRTAAEPSAIAREVRDAIRSADPELAVFDITTLEATVLRSIARERSTMRLLGAFAIIALFLALIGVHGVLSYTVSQRRRELGVRLALGAERRNVLSMVVGQGMRLVAVGLVIGLLAAAAGTRLLSTLLFGVDTIDPLTFGAVSLLVGTVALVAAWLPARRATAIDPAITLRTD